MDLMVCWALGGGGWGWKVYIYIFEFQPAVVGDPPAVHLPTPRPMIKPPPPTLDNKSIPAVLGILVGRMREEWMCRG